MATPTVGPDRLVRGATNIVTLSRFRDQLTPGLYPTDATVTAAVLNAAGAPLAGLGALPMAYVAGAGEYQGTIPDTADLTTAVSVQITATRAGSKGVWKITPRITNGEP